MDRKTFRILLTLNLLEGNSLLTVWPFFGGLKFLIASMTGIVITNIIARLARVRGIRWPLYTLLLWLSYAGVALAVGMVDAVGRPEQIPESTRHVLLAPVASWKQVLTVDTPVGDYLPAVALILFVLIFSLGFSFKLANLTRRGEVLAVSLMLLAWILILMLQEVDVPSGRSSYLLLVPVVATLFPVFSGLLARQKSGRALLVKTGIGTVTVLVGVSVSQVLYNPDSRITFRSFVSQELEETHLGSPLDGYSKFSAGGMDDAVLFTFRSQNPPERLKLANLSSYNGQRMLFGDSPDTPGTSFKRAPADLQVGLRAKSVGTLTVYDYNEELLALPGGMKLLRTASNPAPNNRSGEEVVPFVNRGSSAFFIAGLKPGSQQVFEVSFNGKDERPGRKRSREVPDSAVPDSLLSWLDEKTSGSVSRPSLKELIHDLRKAAYLRGENDSGIPGRPGHSGARISELFEAMIGQELPGALLGEHDPLQPRDSEASLFAADEEQLAVAAFLIADRLGYDARVSVGYVLDGHGDEQIPICAAAGCARRDTLAWLEVWDEQGEDWTVIDVTPLNPVPPVDYLVETREPRYSVVPETVTVDPLWSLENALRGGGDTPAAEPVQKEEVQREVAELIPAWARTVLMILGFCAAGISLPAMLKGMRTLIALRKKSARALALACWRELENFALDSGVTFAPGDTRRERAFTVEKMAPGALAIADLADSAQFSRIDVESFVSGQCVSDTLAWKKTVAVNSSILQNAKRILSISSLVDGVKLRARGYDNSCGKAK